MIFEGCQGKSRTPVIQEKTGPRCGEIIELFAIDTEIVCGNCDFTADNDTLSCIQWCKYARQRVREEMYNQMMENAVIQTKNKEEIA